MPFLCLKSCTTTLESRLPRILFDFLTYSLKDLYVFIATRNMFCVHIKLLKLHVNQNVWHLLFIRWNE